MRKKTIPTTIPAISPPLRLESWALAVGGDELVEDSVAVVVPRVVGEVVQGEVVVCKTLARPMYHVPPYFSLLRPSQAMLHEDVSTGAAEVVVELQ